MKPYFMEKWNNRNALTDAERALLKRLRDAVEKQKKQK